MTDAYLIFGSLFLIGIAIAILFICTDIFWDCWDDCSPKEIEELEKYRSDDESN
jgi:hypothetical protein